MEEKKEMPEKILFVDFNQDGSLFCIGAETGFAIFNSSNCEEILSKKTGGISRVSLIKKTNIFGLIGGGHTPQFAKNKVIIWDESIKNRENKAIMELRFNSDVINLKLKQDKIIVILIDKIYIFDFNTLEIFDIINTVENEKGLIAVSSDDNKLVIAYPADKNRGLVSIKKYAPIVCKDPLDAHENSIGNLALNADGSLLATCSIKGTIIRIFSVSKGKIIQEFRRGSTSTIISCLLFNSDSTFLASSSESGTVHIFQVNKDAAEKEKEKNKGIFSIFGENFEKSFAKIRLNGVKGETIVSFGPDNSIYALETRGVWHMGHFDPLKGGESKKCANPLPLSIKTKLKIC